MSALVTTTEFDIEVGLRLEGDARLAAYTGHPLDSGVPANSLPAYSGEGDDSLVTLVDDDSLLLSIYKLDTGKNLKQTYYENAVEILTNPRHVRFGDEFKITPLDTNDIIISIDGEVVWGPVESETIIPLRTTLSKFPSGQFATGGRVTYVTITRGSSTYQVVATVELCGRRGIIVPKSDIIGDLELKRTLVFEYTGADQAFTVATGETRMIIKCFGAGGGSEVASGFWGKGGAGGYTWGQFEAVAADQYSVVVGQSGTSFVANPYGFGGDGLDSNHVHGGGLSGVFTGSGAVLVTDADRALVIAGGGGGGNVATGSGDGVWYHGSHGNQDTATELTFEGLEAADDTMLLDSHPGGGGGYLGGGYTPLYTHPTNGSLAVHSGAGGQGYLDSASEDGAIIVQEGYTFNTDSPSPGAYDTNYVPGTGGTNQHGCVVVLLYGPA